MDEDNFSNDVNKALAQYKDMAAKACNSGSCEYVFDSGWAPTLGTSWKNPVKEDYAGMGQVQLNVTGRITATRGSDGNVRVTGAYQISIFKAWNFDCCSPDEYPDWHGHKVYHDFYSLPAFGYVRNYILRGTSGEMAF